MKVDQILVTMILMDQYDLHKLGKNHLNIICVELFWNQTRGFIEDIFHRDNIYTKNAPSSLAAMWWINTYFLEEGDPNIIQVKWLKTDQRKGFCFIATRVLGGSWQLKFCINVIQGSFLRNLILKHQVYTLYIYIKVGGRNNVWWWGHDDIAKQKRTAWWTIKCKNSADFPAVF